jgi:hypothetical protein
MANTDKRIDELSNLSSLTGDELVLLQNPTTLEYGKTTLANVSAKSPVTSVAGRTGAVSLTKDDVGLSNVENTADVNKPISSATQAALNSKEPIINSGDTSQYFRGDKTWQTLDKSAVGLGNADNTSDLNKPISTATQAALDTKATTTALDAHANSTSNPHSVTKAQVGLGNAENTSDADKPVSTAQQTALNAKANASDTVNLTGNQTVAGVKTFSSSPIVPTATTTTQAVNKAQMDTADAAHVAAADPHPQYMNSDRGDARYAGQPYAVMAKSRFASLPSSYGTLGRIFSNDGYKNDLQVYGLSTQAGTPTPDVPVPIVSTTGNVTVNSRNKNLFNANLQTGNFRNVVVSSIDNSITLKSTVNDASFTTYRIDGIQPNTTYTLSRDISVTGGTGAASDGVAYINLNNVYLTNIFKNQQSITFTTNSTTTYLGIQFYTYDAPRGSYVEMTVAMTNIQLEVGSTKTVAEKNTTTTQTLPLATTQLRSLPNGVSDRIYKDGSTWKLEQNVGEYTITSGMVGNYNAAGGRSTFPSVLIYKSDIGMAHLWNGNTILSNKYQVTNTMNIDKTVNTNGSIQYVWFNDSSYTDLTSAQAILNGSTVIVQLATPTTTTITDPTLITALENIRTYQGITNITASTPVSGSYGLDLTNTLAGKVDTTGNQTIAGVKTFSSAPIAPSGTSIGGALHLTGTGFPNGVVTAPTGSIYIDTNVTNGASSWIKKSGTGNTGWKILEGDTGQRDITASVINGWTASKVFVRRVNNNVYLQVEGLNAAAMTNIIFATLSAGLRGYSNAYVSRMMLHSATGPVAAWRVNIDASGGVYVGNSTTATPVLYGLAPFPTLDDWPSSLPGTAA